MYEWFVYTSSVCGNNESSLGYADSIHYRRHRVSRENVWTTMTRNQGEKSKRSTSGSGVVFSQLTLILIAYNTWARSFEIAFEDFVRRLSKPLTTEYLENLLLDSVPNRRFKETEPQERLFEIIGRLGALFGSGWFFEWPRGKRPLNSTWPWADVKPSLLVLWGVCWMFVIAHPLNIGGRGYSPGNSLGGRNQNEFVRGRQQQRSADYYLTPPAQTQSPVVKRETLGQTHSLRGDDWPLFPPTVDPMNINEAYQIYSTTTSNSAPPQQPIIPVMMQATDSRQYHQAVQTDTTAPLTAMRNSSSRLTTLSPAQGILQEFPNGNTHTNPHRHSNTNTNTNDLRRVAENLNATQAHSQNYGASGLRYHESPNPNPVKRGHTVTPENSGEVLGQQHHQAFPNNLQQQQQQQQRSYYESSRHGNTKPILRSTVSSSHFTNTPYLPSFATNDTMSIAYEHRPFEGYPTMSMHGDPQEQDDSNMQHARYPSPGAGISGHPYNDPVVDQTAADMALELQQQQQQELPQQQKEESLPPSPGRLRPIPKPDREITKTEEGKYICMWQGCTEDQRLFNRKCEWSKHMDKHDRPYKCPSDGCEKLPGFTYSGGLLRHQREVHNLHGGPRKQLNCHYPNCKRHSGKGFSRQENLNEHLRRVHTTPAGGENAADETEDDSSEGRPWKRKRGNNGPVDDDVRIELNKLRVENDELRRNSELQSQQLAQLTRDLMNMQSLMHASGRMDGGAPQAMM